MRACIPTVLLTLVSLLAVSAQYMVIGESIGSNKDIDIVNGTAQAGAEGIKNDLPTRSLTNAERMQKGLRPAFPRQLEGVLGSRARRDRGRSIQRMRRAPACVSGAPIVFPPHPDQVNPTVLYTGANGDFDDYSTGVSLSFPVNIFGTTSNQIYVSTNGLISFADYAGWGNEPLYADIGTAAVFAFWDDLFVLSGTPNQITISATATDFSVRWQVTTFADRGTSNGNDLDFTLYYTTASPGRFYAYYDVTSSRIGASSGSSATIGAQGPPGSELFNQYSFDSPGVITEGTRLAFDTACTGSTTRG